MNQLSERYLEDFAVGQTFGSGRLRIDGERALAFAAEFDPQPFHLDEAAARRSIFGGLTASGWHTAAVTMRLLIETRTQAGWRHRRRWPRRVPLAPASAPRRRVARRVRGDRGATVEVASGAGPDQAANDHPEPGRRGRAGACREPGRAAPEGHSAGATVGKLQGKAAVIAGSTTRIGFAAATFSSRAVARRSLTRPQKPLGTMSLASRETSLSWLTLIGSTRPSMRNGGECHR